MLSIRLQKVLEHVLPFDKLADVGCDHGYLGLAALEKGVSFLQLIDNKKMPLQKAKDNFIDVNKDNVVFTLSDGIKDLDESINVVSICGMGGDLISKIINDSIETAKKLDRLILEPNTKDDRLREFLYRNNFMIFEEDVVFEKKFYHIIVCKYVYEKFELTNLELKYGKRLLEKRDKVFLDYLNFRLIKQKEIYKLNSQETIKNEIIEIEGIINGYK